MKKIVLLIILLSVFNIFAFAQESNADREEIDYLLFLPDSSNQFTDEARAAAQLDNIARYLRTKTITDAQVFVYGYAADVANDIDPLALSRDRALFVINELQKRGIPREYFTAPVGYGSVNMWGNNAEENSRSPNRRVRILFEDKIISPEVIFEAEEEMLAYEAAEYFDAFDNYEYNYYDPFENESAYASKDADSFNWWWLLLLLLPLLLLLWPKRKTKKTQKEKEAPQQPKPAPAPAAAPIAAAPVRPEGGEPKHYRLTEEEIRNEAYRLFEERNHQHGYDESDWHSAISRLFAKYEAQGYIVLWP